MDQKTSEWAADSLVKCNNKVVLRVGGFAPVSVAVARRKPWDRERATAQSTSGSVRDENKTNTGNGLRASTTVEDKQKRALDVFEKKISCGFNFLGCTFPEKCTKKTNTLLQPALLYRQSSNNGTYMIYVLFGYALQVTCILWVLGWGKRTTFLHR